ncbi:phosphoethanolamine--lipid A transferase [uncultured Ferrimonas sp.]|uniref:phosphoethanolamine transferase n=1 Tax=uncultured Ferrimonas sp. TaxID=432640 RepID=UPI002629D42D|nr:phosphoethanolamine--lipid A transferase [uncultured Ferrimonas sp.]
MLIKQKLSLCSSSLVMLMALYFGVVLNFPLTSKFYQLAQQSGDPTFALTAPLLLAAAFGVIFSLVNVPLIRKPLYALLLLSSATAAFATYQYGVVFDYGMIENVFETHSSEAAAYLNARSVFFTLVFGLLPALLLTRVRITKQKPMTELLQRTLVLAVSVVVIAIIAAAFYKNYAAIGRNNSYLNKMINPSHIYNSVKYINQNYLSTALPYRPLGEDATVIAPSNGKPNLTILVVGETARAANMQYNGYPRATNPFTQSLGMLAFQDVSSCGTATAHSLPCMFSNLDRNQYDKRQANSQDNALDVISHTGRKVVWIDNDGGDKNVAKNISLVKPDPQQYPQYCNGGSCYDAVMLPELEQQLAQNNGEDLLLAMHVIGSHGPTYHQRFPPEFERFSPSCNRSDIENCSDEEIVNVYDNTIAYTDYILAQLIQRLQQLNQQYNVALMYISDHGESLGENGLYLHGTPYALAPSTQTQVPWLLWMDPAFSRSYGIDRQCLAQQRNQPLSHDNLFHTLISLAGVQSSVVDSSKDLFSGCRN